MNGQPPTDQQVRERLLEMKDVAMSHLKDMAQRMSDNMDNKMYDQLEEGGWHDAFSDFLDDVTTFPSAFLKGPVVRNKPRLQWDNGELKVESDAL